MKRSNVNTCPHVGEWRHKIETIGKTVFLCPWCCSELLKRLADPELIRGMIKSTMTAAEIQKMWNERENMRIEQELADEVSVAHAEAGYPRRAMITATAWGDVMAVELIPCEWCGRDYYPNQLTHSEHHGGKVCPDCRADQGPEDRRPEPETKKAEVIA